MVVEITQINETKKLDRDQKALNLVRETRVANIAKLANMLIDLFGMPEAFEKNVKPKREGKIVELEFPALKGSVYVSLTRDKDKFHAIHGKPPKRDAAIIINVDRAKTGVVLGKLIRQKSNIFGLLSLLPNILRRKMKIKGSLWTALTLARIMMIGKNDVYKDK